MENKKYVVLEHLTLPDRGLRFWSMNSKNNTHSLKGELWYKEIHFTNSTEDAINICRGFDKLTKRIVIGGSNKEAIDVIHKLIVKYSKIGDELEKRQKAVSDFHDLVVIDLQIKTNKNFVNDLMLAGGSLL